MTGRRHRPYPLFREFAMGDWQAAASARWRALRRRQVERNLENQLLPAFGTLRLDRIRRLDVERWFDVYSKTAPGGANLALQLLRQILNGAVDAGLIAANPTDGIRRNPRPKLTRFLSTVEIDRLHRCARPIGRRTAVPTAAGRHHPAASPHRLPQERDRQAEMDRGRRRCAPAGGDQDRLADGVAERGGTGHLRPPGTHWEPLRVPVAEGSGKTVHPRRPALVPREEGSGDRGCSPARSQAHGGEPGGGAGRRAVGRLRGCSDMPDPTMTLRYAHVGDRDVQAAAERVGQNHRDGTARR